MKKEQGKKAVLAYNFCHCENTEISVPNDTNISQEMA
jgi:hypothetical protein